MDRACFVGCSCIEGLNRRHKYSLAFVVVQLARVDSLGLGSCKPMGRIRYLRFGNLGLFGFRPRWHSLIPFGLIIIALARLST